MREYLISSNTMTFGARIKQLRIAKGITQHQLSADSGIPFYTIVALEYNRTKVPLVTTVIKLADYFKISIPDLITGVSFFN